MKFIFFLIISTFTVCNGFSLVATTDADHVKKQLGYLPLNFHSVSARTSNGSPLAIKAYPLLRKKGSEDKPLSLSSLSASPFPTHYWLTCPEVSRAIGEMERVGYIGLIEDFLNLECNFAKRQHLLQCHQQCGVDRWESLTDSDRQFFLDHGDTDSTVARMKGMLAQSGVSGLKYHEKVDQNGILKEVTIKCLHTHYAYFCSTTKDRELESSNNSTVENPIGRIVHDILLAMFPTLKL